MYIIKFKKILYAPLLLAIPTRLIGRGLFRILFGLNFLFSLQRNKVAFLKSICRLDEFRVIARTKKHKIKIIKNLLKF